MRRMYVSFPFTLLLLLTLTSPTLQAITQVATLPPIRTVGVIHYNDSMQQQAPLLRLELGWLHTDGIWVKDSAGKKVAMRMIANFPWHMSRPKAEIDLSRLIQNSKSHGINVIFFGISPWNDVFYFDYDTHVSQLDAKVNLCKQNGIYAALVYFTGTTALASQHGISGVDNVINHLVSFWTPIIEHYKDEPAVVGVKLIDEPNLNSANEHRLWTQTIGTLRLINPNLLWFTHTIGEIRFGQEYWHLIPWKTTDELPYPNILMDGGIWLSSNHPDFGFDFASDDYAAADALFSDVTARMENFRSQVQIPTGITPGIDETYTINNARTYFLTKIHRWMEEKNYVLTLYVADYQLSSDDGFACLNKVFPDTPYPYYW